MSRLPNPIRGVIAAIGLLLVRMGFIAPERVRRTTDLAWPRIVTGIARMSKNAVDVALVGLAIGPAAIAGVGFAGPYWGFAFAIGGGVAAGTIALVSQRYGAGVFGELGQAIRSSALLVVLATLPVTAVFWFFPAQLISIMTSDKAIIGYGATYLKLVSLGVPFAGLNLVGSRIYIGCDDAFTPMVLRAGGAITNIVLSSVLVFGFGMGVAGAAVGTVISNVIVTAVFSLGVVSGWSVGADAPSIAIDPFGSYLDLAEMRQIVSVGLPVAARSLVWTVANFPMLAIVGLFGSNVVAAYVIARRIWGLMNTPGWGFGLASSSLVGQELGRGNERIAEAYGQEIILFSLATYVVAAAIVFVAARPIVLSFVGNPADPAVPIAITLVHVACVAILAQAVSGAAAGPLDATGDTVWPFCSQALGMFGFSIPVAYLGALTMTPTSAVLGVTLPSIGMVGIYLSFFAETTVPAALNYYRFSNGRWKILGRRFAPATSCADD